MTWLALYAWPHVEVAAAGVSKAETVQRALEDDDLEPGQLPGGMVDAFSTIWFLDMGAASKLQAYSAEQE
jgi:6-phosphogluconolactonase